jgi:hypothetical protein
VLKSPLYLSALTKNKGVAAIKNIKKKIIGEMGSKTDREKIVGPLK